MLHAQQGRQWIQRNRSGAASNTGYRDEMPTTHRRNLRWRRKRDSLARKNMITHKLLIFQLARLAQFASKRRFWQL
jgi:hypothetical protein